jgi:hypothetical protein
VAWLLPPIAEEGFSRPYWTGSFPGLLPRISSWATSSRPYGTGSTALRIPITASWESGAGLLLNRFFAIALGKLSGIDPAPAPWGVPNVCPRRTWTEKDGAKPHGMFFSY